MRGLGGFDDYDDDDDDVASRALSSGFFFLLCSPRTRRREGKGMKRERIPLASWYLLYHSYVCAAFVAPVFVIGLEQREREKKKVIRNGRRSVSVAAAFSTRQ